LIRNYHSENDLSTIAHLHNRAFLRERITVRSWTAENVVEEFLHRPWWNPTHCWLAFSDQSAPLGTITLAFRHHPPSPPRPVVHWLLVDPLARRRGVARSLLRNLEAKTYELGFRELALETHRGWTAAAAFYAAEGFRPDP
jgi:GNAT superfamily N-acetyltransferase